MSSRLKLLARTNTNTLALHTALNRIKLLDSPVYEACPHNATQSLQHFLLEYPAYKNIRDQRFQDIIDHMNVCMPSLDFTELSSLQKLYFFIENTCYYVNQEYGDFFDRIGKTMLKTCSPIKCFKYSSKYIFNTIPKQLSILFYFVICT